MVSQAAQGLWWSHRQSVYGFKDFLLWAASASPMCAASALGTVPTLHCKTRLEFLTVSLPRHKLQLRSFLHPAHSGGGTPLGVLLALFIFPACVDLFLCSQILLIRQRALPNTANFNLKTHQI